MENKNSSFTLIELLVVIAIIGILTAIIVVSLGSASGSAKDARRKADINQMAKALMIYSTNNPDFLFPEDIAGCEIGGTSDPCGPEIMTALGKASSLRDPDSNKYYSYRSNGVCYKLLATTSENGEYSFDSCTGIYSLIINFPVNGVCGSSNDTIRISAPTEDLCLAGTATEVSGSGPWTWSCEGLHEGTDASCSAESVQAGFIDTGLGFYVMKYEAKESGGIPVSQTAGSPWVNITQEQAKVACESLGSRYHLISNEEWMALARNIEAQDINWSGGSVGSGFLSKGYAANSFHGDAFTNDAFAPTTGPGSEYNSARNTVTGDGTNRFKYRRTHYLSNGQVIWDLSGNAYDWTSTTSITDYLPPYSGAWREYDTITLWGSIGNQGPSNSSYNSTQYVGRIYTDYDGASPSGSIHAFLRGGLLDNGNSSGIYGLNLSYSPNYGYLNIGFRCAAD